MKGQDEGRVAIRTYFTAHTPNVSPVLLEAERNCFLAVFEKRVKKGPIQRPQPFINARFSNRWGGKIPRAHTEVGLVLRYDVLSVLAARLPLVVRATGEGVCPHPHPSSRRPPRLCLRESEWRSAHLHNAAQTPTGWLTDWRCCAPWNRDSDWARRHPPAGSQSLIPIPIHDHPNEDGAGNTGVWVERTCSDPCFGMRNAVPLTFHLSRCYIADFSPPESGAAGQTFTVHHLSPVRLLRHGSSHPVTDIIDQGLFCLSLSDSLISYRAKLVSNEMSNC